MKLRTSKLSRGNPTQRVIAKIKVMRSVLISTSVEKRIIELVEMKISPEKRILSLVRRGREAQNSFGLLSWSRFTYARFEGKTYPYFIEEDEI